MLMVHLLVQSRLPVVGSLLSDLLNHLDDLLPGLAVLGEDVDILGGKLHGSLSSVIDGLDVEDKVPRLDKLAVRFPLRHWLVQPLGASPSNVEELPRLACYQDRELHGGGEVRVGGEPKLDGVIRGQGH